MKRSKRNRSRMDWEMTSLHVDVSGKVYLNHKNDGCSCSDVHVLKCFQVYTTS